jgi:hypothetical protein
LFVSFGVPAITADEFFEPTKLVSNFALLLGVDPSKIRLVKIVKATGLSGRKRQGINEKKKLIFSQ